MNESFNKITHNLCIYNFFLKGKKLKLQKSDNIIFFIYLVKLNSN